MRMLHLDVPHLFYGRSLMCSIGLGLGVAALLILQTLVGTIRQGALAGLGGGTEDVLRVEFTRQAASAEVRRVHPSASEIIPGLQARLGPLHRVGTFAEGRRTAIFEGRRFSVSAVGVSPSYFDIHAAAPNFGRAFVALDRLQPVALLGVDQARALAGSSRAETLLGRDLLIDETVFSIVGILPSTRTPLKSSPDLDDTVLVPAEVFERRLGGEGVSELYVGLQSPAEAAVVEATVRQFLSPREGGEGIKFVRASELRIRAAAEIRALTFALAGFGAFTFGLGTFGLVSLHFANVGSRRREIGLRRACGATRRHITTWFLSEALLQALLGAALGLVLGVLFLSTLAAWKGWQVKLAPEAIAAAVGGVLLVGASSGYLAGRTAAKTSVGAAARSQD